MKDCWIKINNKRTIFRIDSELLAKAKAKAKAKGISLSGYIRMLILGDV